MRFSTLLKRSPLFVFSSLLLGTTLTAYGVWSISAVADEHVDDITESVNELVLEKGQLQKEKEDALYQYHLLEMEYKSLQEEVDMVDVPESSNPKLDEIYTLYEEVIEKVERNENSSIETIAIDEQARLWGAQVLNQEYDRVITSLSETSTSLDADFQTYLASLPTPVPTAVPQAPAAQPQTAPSAAGYSYQTVQTNRGAFGTYLIKMRLSEVTVKTVTANQDDCKNNCPAKALQQYVQENNAYAGIHGSYFCPPDYADCANKTYSYDFAVYNSNLGKWLNQHALAWNDLGLLTFNGRSAQYYKDSNTFGGGAVTAGISNFPSLVANGNVVVDESKLSSYQTAVKGSRGAIGVNNEFVFMAVISGATVTDAAHVMRALGATGALNLDGGGSSALYINGGYKVGPGRSLPNAILLVK